MSQAKTLSLQKESLNQIILFSLLLSATMLAPFIKQQAITGTIVNAALFLSVIYLQKKGAVLIALIPSIFSLAIGFLPSIFWPMIPFIITGNIILIFTFSNLRQKNYWLAVISGAFLKFIFLAASANLIAKFLLGNFLAEKAVIIFSWPQLITAMSGGILAYLISKIKNKS